MKTIYNATAYVKDLLKLDKEICKYNTQLKDLRKIIALLKSEGWVIYSEECKCNLVKRKHICYVNDWAI